MSIHRAVQLLCDQGQLHRLAAGLGAIERRTLCVSNPINDLLRGPWQDEPHKQVWMRAAQHLAAFIEEEFLTVRVGPPKDDAAQVARLEPAGHQVWEIRCLTAGPSLRVFGCIAASDFFVGLHWKFRYELGRFGSPAWKAAIEYCKDEWRRLLPQHTPLIAGAEPYDYISGAIAV